MQRRKTLHLHTRIATILLILDPCPSSAPQPHVQATHEKEVNYRHYGRQMRRKGLGYRRDRTFQGIQDGASVFDWCWGKNSACQWMLYISLRVRIFLVRFWNIIIIKNTWLIFTSDAGWIQFLLKEVFRIII